ncbi:PREDICTED: RNA-binding protein 39 [Bactrocera latifrons]|uniref:RNA-binding protein 39 n=2 Tax=Bactrocera latifrons TaxID=174628 RepID=A0A0K8VQV4_BACLA|nr:PREDICTED: RNA-binding protein 39 [Bactrocera latifrons]XP_018783446.1 PREDICTED: RNA-binding protein 39 [Bactrocera latifrons]XP_018783448.1 PREDICTED: RNA-binding protein 39 [Bactrocera latifrons]
MAEDFDVEAMLEAPYIKNNVPSRGGDHDASSRKSPYREHQESSSSKGGSKSSSHLNGRKHYSRSRSGSPRTTDDRKARKSKDRDRQRDRDESSYSKDRDRIRDKDRLRDRERNGERERRYGSQDRDRDRERDRDRDAEKRRSRSKDRRRCSRSRERDRRSRERRGSRPRSERRRSRSPTRDRRSREKKLSPIREYKGGRPGFGSNSRERSTKRRSNSPRPFRRGRTPPNGLGDRSPRADLSPEERDARTVFCMQLSQRIRARDLEEFFSSVGKVRDVRLITCNKTKRFKGIAYIEFKDPESVALALGLSGQKLLGIPISVQHTQAEKNRIANAVPTFTPKNHTGPMRLYVGSLHFNITEDMLKGIFEPFGKIDSIQLIMDTETGRSKGYGFITYHNADDAKKALEQLNGFELAGRPMKVGNVTERLDMNTSSLDTDEMDRSGIDLGATGRLQLMFKLAEGAGLAVPQAAANALLATAPQPAPIQTQTQTPAIATQCFMLSNMFDPRTETNPAWDSEIRDDVIDECSKHGGVLHIFVDKASPTGNVYVKCPSITTAVLAVNALHGRWFAGRVITAAYVPLLNYHSLFPDAITAVNLLASKRKSGE